MLRFTVEAITSPGDKIAVFSPVYDPFFAIVENTGRTLPWGTLMGVRPTKLASAHLDMSCEAFAKWTKA